MRQSAKTFLSQHGVKVLTSVVVMKDITPMEIPQDIVKSVLKEYVEEAFYKVLPDIIREVVSTHGRPQDCIPLSEAMLRYDLSKPTLYNYHKRGYIKLYSSDGRTYVSIHEMEVHIKSHPLPNHGKS